MPSESHQRWPGGGGVEIRSSPCILTTRYHSPYRFASLPPHHLHPLKTKLTALASPSSSSLLNPELPLRQSTTCRRGDQDLGQNMAQDLEFSTLNLRHLGEGLSEDLISQDLDLALPIPTSSALCVTTLVPNLGWMDTRWTSPLQVGRRNWGI